MGWGWIVRGSLGDQPISLSTQHEIIMVVTLMLKLYYREDEEEDDEDEEVGEEDIVDYVVIDLFIY